MELPGPRARPAWENPGASALPLAFEPNYGQADASVKYLSRGRRHTVFLTAGEAVLAPAGGSAIRLKLIGARADAPVEGLQQLSGKSNYFVGQDRRKWRSGIPNYARIVYRKVYPGIDLVYYGKNGELEYDFIVAPDGDPTRIRLAFEGIDGLKHDAEGNLVLRAGGNQVVQRLPRIYQEVDGRKRTIAGKYKLLARNEVGFELGPFDRAQPLVIDPALAYSTYIGGSEGETGARVAVDTAGNMYVLGSTTSLDFPSPAPFSPGRARGDLFVLKMNPSGSAVLYSTYLGGSLFDFPSGLVVDSSGYAYVAGTTNSFDFPTTAGAFQSGYGGGEYDAFVAKLDSAGAVVFSTYLGTSGGASFGLDGASGVAVDTAGNVYLIGNTGSMAFPTVNPVQPGCAGYIKPYVAKFNSTGSALVYASCFLGGVPAGIAVDAAGNAYLAGVGLSAAGAPAANHVTKINATGSAVVYSTNVGGIPSSIAVDAGGRAYVTGIVSSDLPTIRALQPTFGGQTDAFVTRLSASGSVDYSTYLGGSGRDRGTSVATDAGGNVYVTGETFSADFPTWNAWQPASASSNPDMEADVFVAGLNALGSAFLFSSYLGGSSGESPGGITADAFGNVYVTGGTGSSNFPTVGALKPALSGHNDAFLVKIKPELAGLSEDISIPPRSRSSIHH